MTALSAPCWRSTRAGTGGDELRRARGRRRPGAFRVGRLRLRRPVLPRSVDRFRAGCELAWVATRSAQRRAFVGRDHPDAVVVDDLAGLVAAGAEAVVVSTPAETHIPLCREALELGVPVVVDKPFALAAAEARGAVELAERLGAVFSVYQNRRWDSDFRTVRALARGGALGEITRFESRFERRQDGPPAAGGGTHS